LSARSGRPDGTGIAPRGYGFRGSPPGPRPGTPAIHPAPRIRYPPALQPLHFVPSPGRLGGGIGGTETPVSQGPPSGVLLAGMDAEGFDTLVATHHREIYRYLVRATFRASQADGLAQETFLPAYPADRAPPPDAP